MKRVNNDEKPELSRVDLWHMHATVITGNAIQIATNTSQIFNLQTRQNPAANNDYWEQYVWLKKGTYTLSVVYIKTTASAICTLAIIDADAQIQAYGTNLDMYGAAAFNQVFTASVTIPRTSKYNVNGRANSRKAANTTGWDIFITLVTLIRTGD